MPKAKTVYIPDSLLPYLEPENPKSLYSLAPVRLKEALSNLPIEYLRLDESELMARVKPTRTLNALRYSFWREFQRAQESGETISLLKTFEGICSSRYVYANVFKNTLMTAWLITPPATYEVMAEEALEFGIVKLRNILELPLSVDGKTDHKTANLILSTIRLLDARVKGAPTQKHEIKQLNVNASMKDVTARAAEMSMEEIEKRLNKLKGQSEKISLNPMPDAPKILNAPQKEINEHVTLVKGLKKEF